MEVVVLDVGLHAVRLHESVVLLAAVARVRADLARHAGIPGGKGAEEGPHRERVPRIGEEAEVGDELVLRAYLKVVAWLNLPVVHRVLLHPHERGVGVSLAVGVATAKLLQMAGIGRYHSSVWVHEEVGYRYLDDRSRPHGGLEGRRKKRLRLLLVA